MSSLINHLDRRCPGPLSRRNFLQVGALGIGGLGLADLLRLRAEANEAGSAKSDTAVILVWLPGGPPHMETYDMKPDAPAEYRGELRPIRTNVPGIDVCELLPLHAKVADRFTLIRSIAHEFADHGGGHKRFMSGRIPKMPAGNIPDAPSVGSIVAKMRDHVSRGVPNYISIGIPGVDSFALGPAYLGPSYTSYWVVGDPSESAFQVRNLAVDDAVLTRLNDRRALLKGMDRTRRNMDGSGAMEAMDRFGQQAFELLTNEDARSAFDLSRVDPQVRARYGNHSWGLKLLLARQLVEAGSSLVTAILGYPEPHSPRSPGIVGDWDSHAVNGHLYRDARFRLPYLDQAVSALIEDLYVRGLDKKVMVIVSGEFGRSPRLESVNDARTGGETFPGRDHWPQAMSVLVSGGGMRMGQVIGATNSKGEYPTERPLTPNDLWATMYRHLGIDYTHAFPDLSGRPMPILPFGEPISELL